LLARLARLIAAAAVVFGAASTTAALPVRSDHACMGRWVGEGRNSNSPRTWTIDLTLTAAPSGGRCGTIEYENPDCGGTLERCEVVDGDIHTVERYEHTSADCAPPGRVVIRCEGDTMRYSWIGWERVDSTLHRPEGWEPGPQPSIADPSEPDRDGPGPGENEPGPGDGEEPAPGPPAPPTDTGGGGDGCAAGCAAGGGAPPLGVLPWLVLVASASVARARLVR